MTDQRDIDSFVRDYSKELEENNAAVFIGAGLSVGAGHVDWAELLKPIADDLGLDIDRETDLVALAQYHKNEERSRSKLNRILIEEFAQGATISENHLLLAKMPINVYWTTNYDKLIEKALEESGKNPDVKSNDKQLAFTKPGRDAVVYKMHGDVDRPDEAVLIKDDYEKYHRTRQLFMTALSGDLVSMTFLFLGFSFSDPNLDYVLSRIRVSMEEDGRNHYALLRRVQKSDDIDEEEYQYRLRRQLLFINDLKRYSIKTLLIDEYSQITEILRRIHETHRRKSVLVSGAAVEYGNWGEDRAIQFVRSIGKSLMTHDFRLVSGFGLGIGSGVITGALEQIYSDSALSIADKTVLRPFPQVMPEGISRSQFNTKYRVDLVSNAGIALFVFGNKLEDGNVINSPGVEEEFDIARELGLAVIPIGATGYMAQILWQKVFNDFQSYFPDHPELKEPFQVLGDNDADNDKLLAATMKIATTLSRKT